MSLFRRKYRIESARLPGWDYAGYGWYFVTICTKDRKCVFGDIVNGKIHLSSIGKIVADEWQKTASIRSDVVLDEWVVMPNHIHGIVVIDGKGGGTSVETRRRRVSTDQQRRVSTDHAQPIPFRLQPRSLGAVINQFKSICTKRIWKAGFSDFSWQTRYYDHIIRNEQSLDRIRAYILRNPSCWKEDRNNPSGRCN
jgi:REP element-mobilizing transposase RayT